MFVKRDSNREREIINELISSDENLTNSKTINIVYVVFELIKLYKQKQEYQKAT